jgi:hypothetical protein
VRVKWAFRLARGLYSRDHAENRGALGLLLSCKRQAPPPPAPTPSAAVVDAAPAPSSSAAEVEPHDPLKDLARQWSDAINKRDIAALGAMPGSTARFYGVSVDNKTYCAKMKAALDKDPSFHQDIAALRVEWPSSTRAERDLRSIKSQAGWSEAVAPAVADTLLEDRHPTCHPRSGHDTSIEVGPFDRSQNAPRTARVGSRRSTTETRRQRDPRIPSRPSMHGRVALRSSAC